MTGMYTWTTSMQRLHRPGLIRITGTTAGRLHSIPDGTGDTTRLHGDLLHGDLAGTPGGDQAGEAAGIRDGVTVGIRGESAEDGTQVEDGILAEVITIMEDITIQPISTQMAEDLPTLMQEAELQEAPMTDLTAIPEEEPQEAIAQADLHQDQEAAATV